MLHSRGAWLAGKGCTCVYIHVEQDQDPVALGHMCLLHALPSKAEEEAVWPCVDCRQRRRPWHVPNAFAGTRTGAEGGRWSGWATRARTRALVLRARQAKLALAPSGWPPPPPHHC